MEHLPLEITLISADDIKKVSMFGKMHVYVVAFIYGYPETKKKTRVDKNCGTSPRWDQKLQFTIEERSLYNPGLTLVIHLKASKSFLPDQTIGEVIVPIVELYKNVDHENGEKKTVEYQVRTSLGKPKGTLKLSYKFGDKLSHDNGDQMKKAEEPVAGYLPPGYGDKLSYDNGDKMKKAEEPVTAYPPPGYGKGEAGGSMPAAAAAALAYLPSHLGTGYQKLVPGYKNPPGSAQNDAYPSLGAYPHPGYGNAPPPGYGYHQQPVQEAKKKKKSGIGMGMGLGLGAGLLGGMLIGDMVSDVGEMAAYADGYGDAMEDATGFDF